MSVFTSFDRSASGGMSSATSSLDPIDMSEVEGRFFNPESRAGQRTRSRASRTTFFASEWTATMRSMVSRSEILCSGRNTAGTPYGQFLLVVGRDHHDRPMDGLDGLPSSR